MLFHKKEKAPEGQQAGTKPEKPRKVRWSERREPSEAGLERFQDYLQTYSTNKDHPIKILCSFYKGKQKKLVETGFFLILQRSPIWIIPIATSNIINAATNPDAGSLEIILLNVMVALLFIMQNAGTNYLATVAFASVNRGIEGSLRNAMVRKLQQRGKCYGAFEPDFQDPFFLCPGYFRDHCHYPAEKSDGISVFPCGRTLCSSDHADI